MFGLDTADGIFLLLHSAFSARPEMGSEGVKAIILALLRCRHACCTAADESSPLA